MLFRKVILKGEDVSLLLERKAKKDTKSDWLPAHYFFILDKNKKKVGVCDLRLGHNDNSYYGGNIGYRVFEEDRGNRYAAKACLLLFSYARSLGMEYVIITCDPDNLASKRTCEILGGELLEITELPEDHVMREGGSTHKCIFRYDLTQENSLDGQQSISETSCKERP